MVLVCIVSYNVLLAFRFMLCAHQIKSEYTRIHLKASASLIHTHRRAPTSLHNTQHSSNKKKKKEPVFKYVSAAFYGTLKFFPRQILCDFQHFCRLFFLISIRHTYLHIKELLIFIYFSLSLSLSSLQTCWHIEYHTKHTDISFYSNGHHK